LKYSQPTTSVLVALGRPIVRAGVVAILSRDASLQVREAGGSVIDDYRAARTDVVLIDVDESLLAGLLSVDRNVKAIVYADAPGDEPVARALRAGACSVLHADVEAGLLPRAVKDVAAGKRCVPPEVGAMLAQRENQRPLTDREADVLRLLATGLANKQIAAKLKVTEGTVKTHVNNLLQKLGVTGRTEATAVAIRRGLVKV
jgi:two-component system, NarL family, response regulator